MSPVRKKLLIFSALLLAIAPVAFIGWYRWDFAQNRGFEFGYYGDFNRVRHALTNLPGVTVTRDWANRDITLEEFGFDIRTSGGQAIPLNFQESDPVRNVAGQRLTRALSDRIQNETSVHSPPK